MIPRQRTHLDNLLAPYKGAVPKPRREAMHLRMALARAQHVKRVTRGRAHLAQLHEETTRG